ncbi:MAG: hypothetical protein M3Z17_03575, partial [Gemmatimonadota bacterium]|nr:hypothetical protein [Gemmatimonadota bacterium]
LVVAGDAQSVVVGSAVATAPTVRLVDADGVAIAGATVTFSVSAGGGSITGATATTDANGSATVGGWTLGTVAGANTLVATSGNLTATFNATGTAARAFSITPVAGKDQSAAVGAKLTTAPAVAVRDTFNNPIAGVTVTFTVASGGGSVTGATATSDANGVATLGGWTLGTTVGANTLIAATAALTTTFSATAVAGPPAKLIIFPGTYASAAIAQPDQKVGQQPNVIISDAFNNPAPNVAVNFSVGASGGTFTASSGRITNQYGVAYVDAWVVGSQPGDYALTATVGTMSVTFHASVIGPRSSVPMAMVRAGYVSTCALDVNGRAYCWGSNAAGQLGDGTTISRSVPTPVTGGLSFTSIAVGNYHTCGLTSSGSAYCWGDNSSGKLGTGGAFSSSSSPVPVAGGLSFKIIAASSGATCGIVQDGRAYCWGNGGNGDLGAGAAISQSSVPVLVAGGLQFTALTAGWVHFCALTSMGKAYCWGGGLTPYQGELGNGLPSYDEANHPAGLYHQQSDAPSPVSGGITFARISAGYFTSCGIDTSGKSYCWGLNNWGQAADGTTFSHGVPAAVTGSDSFADFSITFDSSCGLLANGGTRCWGRNTLGEYGNGLQGYSLNTTPTDGVSGIRLSTLTSGAYHRCALDTGGQVLCWGLNSPYQLDDAKVTLSPSVVTFYQ